MSMALIFWLSGVSLFAQNKQTNKTEPEKKQVPTAQPKVSLSNQQAKATPQDEASIKKAAQEQKSKDEQAAKVKSENLAKEKATPVKHSANVQTTSSKAPTANTSKANSTNQSAKSQDIRKDWEIKKAKMVADMKAKGIPQEDIDKRIASMEKKMNLNNNSIK